MKQPIIAALSYCSIFLGGLCFFTKFAQGVPIPPPKCKVAWYNYTGPFLIIRDVGVKNTCYLYLLPTCSKCDVGGYLCEDDPNVVGSCTSIDAPGGGAFALVEFKFAPPAKDGSAQCTQYCKDDKTALGVHAQGLNVQTNSDGLVILQQCQQ